MSAVVPSDRCCFLTDQEMELLEKNKIVALVTPRKLLNMDSLTEIKEGYGRSVTVFDSKNMARANVAITEVYQTSFGFPDQKLVALRGYEADTSLFHQDFKRFWDSHYPDLELGNDTLIVVEIMQLLPY